MELITIYDGPDACQRCLGWKRIANDDEGLPWKYWAELPSPENLAVQIGIVVPLPCPRCKGSGREPDAGQRMLRIDNAARAVVDAWKRLGRCEDEFEGDPGACGEFREELDTAIAELRDALE
jgi:hypothetical protein